MRKTFELLQHATCQQIIELLYSHHESHAKRTEIYVSAIFFDNFTSGSHNGVQVIVNIYSPK